MKLAVIKTGGKQYKIKEGLELKVEKIEKEIGEKINFEEILLISDEKGKDVQIGDPVVNGGKVEAEILEQGKAKKVEVRKYKAKTRYKRNVGHRQMFTKVKITKIA